MEEVKTESPANEQKGTLPDEKHVCLPQHVQLEGVHNFRDLGGYPTKYGVSVKTGALFRSARLDSSSQADMNYLSLLKTIVDFRDHDEIAHERQVREAEGRPSHFLSPQAQATTWGARLVRLPLATRDGMKEAVLAQATIKHKLGYAFWRFMLCNKAKAEHIMVPVINAIGLLGLNRAMARRSGKSVCAALKLIADPANHPLVFHCTHGKDRTGIIAALVLSCLGVSRDDVIKDYAHSVKLLPGNFMEIEAKRSIALGPEWADSPAHVMQHTLEFIEAEHGSLDNYFDSIGFLEADRKRLRKAMLDVEE